MLSVSTDSDRYSFLQRGKFPSCKEGNYHFTSQKKPSIFQTQAFNELSTVLRVTLRATKSFQSYIHLPVASTGRFSCFFSNLGLLIFCSTGTVACVTNLTHLLYFGLSLLHVVNLATSWSELINDQALTKHDAAVVLDATLFYYSRI